MTKTTVNTVKNTLKTATFATVMALSALVMAPQAFAEMVTVHVNGLVCDFCAQSITKMMQKEAAVEGVHVDMDKKEIHLKVKDDVSFSDDVITKKITDAGYAVVRIERE